MRVREAERLVRVGAALERVRANCDVVARLAADPVGLVHRYDDPLDRELVALVAALIAFGNVKTIRSKLEDLAARLSNGVAFGPARLAEDEPELHRRLLGWKHRVFIGEDVARLLAGARRVQRRDASLGARFARDLARTGTVREALAELCDAIRTEGQLTSKTRRGPAHLLPDPRRSSGSKRLFLYLRWMIRPADGIDFGLWPVDPSVLLCPVDTHIHKLARNLGFTKRPDLSWTTTEEITLGLARYDASDPVKFDFALCHLGMLQRCPSKRDAARCEGCAIKDVCRHWA